MDNRLKESTNVTIKAIILNFILVILKVFAGVVGKSSAMVADGFHSASDMITSIGVLFGNYISSKPNDEGHNYGHEKAETLVSFFLSMMLIMASLKIGYDAVLVFLNLNSVEMPTFLPLIIAVVSIIINEYQFYITIKVANKTNSPSLRADAWHHRSDSLSSVAVLVGVAGTMMGFKVLEPISCLMVAIIVCKAGLEIFMTSMDELMDASVSKEELSKIVSAAKNTEGVLDILYSDLKTRKHGPYIYIDITLIVHEHISVLEGHIIGHNAEENIRKNIENVKGISVHVEPNCQNGVCMIN